MKTLKTIYNIYNESILDDVEISLNKDAKSEIFKIPTIKDFVKNPYNYGMSNVSWDLSNVIDIYKKKYPQLLNKDWHYLHFVIMKDVDKKRAIYVYFAETSDPVTKKIRMMGWEEIVSYNMKQCKEWIIKLINHLAENPEKLDEFFKHANKMKNEIGPFCQNTPLSKLLY